MDEETESMIFYAFRYCLGRMTYAVGTCVDYILNHWDELSVKTKTRIVQEIETALRDHTAGMDMDRDQWQRIVERAKS